MEKQPEAEAMYYESHVRLQQCTAVVDKSCLHVVATLWRHTCRISLESLAFTERGTRPFHSARMYHNAAQIMYLTDLLRLIMLLANAHSWGKAKPVVHCGRFGLESRQRASHACSATLRFSFCLLLFLPLPDPESSPFPNMTHVGNTCQRWDFTA